MSERNAVWQLWVSTNLFLAPFEKCPIRAAASAATRLQDEFDSFRGLLKQTALVWPPSCDRRRWRSKPGGGWQRDEDNRTCDALKSAFPTLACSTICTALSDGRYVLRIKHDNIIPITFTVSRCTRTNCTAVKVYFGFPFAPQSLFSGIVRQIK
jgi:hypothetical protein